MTISIKQVKVCELKPAAYNPRKWSEKATRELKDSIESFGLVDPIICNQAPGRENVVIGGHFRLHVAKQLGYAEVPVVYISVPDVGKEKELNIRLNKNSGDFDLDLLKNFDADLLARIGFDSAELDKIFQEPPTDADDAVPDVPENPKSKLGDIYLLGRHRVMCGDSTSRADVARLMDGKQADMVFTDPPYDLDTVGGGILKNANSMKQIRANKVDKFNPENLFRLAKTSIFFHNKPLIKKYIELSEKWGEAYDLCFYKKENTAPNYGGHLMTDVEYISIIGKQSPNKGLPKEIYSKCFTGKKDTENGLSYSKPVALCEKYVLLYSERGDVVVDIFLGSGSTLIACEKTNRRCYGMELDPKYVDVIVKRWEDFTGQTAEKI